MEQKDLLLNTGSWTKPGGKADKPTVSPITKGHTRHPKAPYELAQNAYSANTHKHVAALPGSVLPEGLSIFLGPAVIQHHPRKYTNNHFTFMSQGRVQQRSLGLLLGESCNLTPPQERQPVISNRGWKRRGQETEAWLHNDDGTLAKSNYVLQSSEQNDNPASSEMEHK